MSRTIDERVVQMTFNNSNFERNAAKSLNTLDKLEQKLEFKDGSKGFKNVEKAANNVKMGGLLSALVQVEHKFSVMEIAGITAISNITNKAVDAGVRLAKSLSLDQITAGYAKYEQKIESVQTIMNATGKSIDEVNGYLQKLMWFSDETSYSFTDMTAALGQFTSSGADIERVLPMITGIANAVAYAGKGAPAFQSALHNLVQSYSAGSIQLQDWKSLENQNVASEKLKQTIIETAREVGTLNEQYEDAAGNLVNIGTFGSTLKDKWATTEVMEKAFSKFSQYSDAVYNLKISDEEITTAQAMAELSGQFDELSEKAFKAGQEAKTFTDAINATKDAVSSSWMNLFEDIFGDYEEAKKTWTELTDFLWKIFGTDIDNIETMVSEAFSDKSNWNTFISDMDRAGISMVRFENDMKRLATASIGADAVGELEEKYGSLENAVRHGELNDLIPEFFDSYVNGAIKAGKGLEGMTTVQKEYNALLQKGMSYDQASYFLKLRRDVRNTKTEFSKTVKSIDELSTRELLVDSFRMVLEDSVKVLDKVREAFDEIFGLSDDGVDSIRALVKCFHDFIESLRPTEERLETIKSIAKALFAILDIGKQTIGVLIQNGIKLLNTILGSLNINIDESITSISDAIVAFDEWLKEGGKVNEMVSWLADGVLYLVGAIKDIVVKISEIPAVQKVLSKLKEVALGVKDAFVSFLEEFRNLDEFTFEGFMGALENLGNSILRVFNFDNLNTGDVEGKLNKLKDIFTKAFGSIWESIKGFGTSLWETIKKINPMTVVLIAGALAFLKVTDAVSMTINSLMETLRPVSMAIKELLDATALFVNDARGVLKAFKFREIAFGVLMLTTAIAALAGSFWLLAKTFEEHASGIVGGSIALGVLAISVGILAAVTRKNRVILKQMSQLFISIGASILLMSAAFAVFSMAESPRAWLAGVSGLIITLAALTTAVVLLDMYAKTAGSTMKGLGLDLLLFSASIAALSAVLLQLNKLDPANLKEKIGALLAVILALSAAATIISHGGNSWNLMAVGVGLLSFVLGLKLLILQIDDVAKLASIIVNHLGELSVVVAFIGALGLALRAAGKVSLGIGAALLSIAASIALLHFVIKSLGKLSAATVAKGSIAVGALLLVFGKIISWMKPLEGQFVKVGGMLLMMTAAISGLALIIWGLGLLDLPTLAKGVGAVGLMMILMDALLVCSKMAENAKDSIYAIAVVIGILSLTIGILSNVADINGTIVVASSLSGLLLAMAGAFAIIGKGRKWKKETIKNLLVLSGIMAALMGVIALISRTNDANINVAITAIVGASLFLMEVAVLNKILKGNLYLTDTKIDNIKQIGAIAAVIGLAISLFAMIPGDPLRALAIATASSIALLGIGVAMERLKKVPKLEQGVIINILALAGIAGALMGVVAAIGIAMSRFGGIDIAQTLTAIAGASILLIAVAEAAKIVNRLGVVPWNIALGIGGEMVLFGVTIFAICAGLALLGKVEVSDLIPKVIAVGALFIAAGVLAAIMAKLRVNLAAGVKGALVVAAFVFLLGTAILGLVGIMAAMENAGDVISDGLAAIGRAIGAAYDAAFVRATQHASEMPEAAESLKAFAGGLKEFTDSLKEVDLDTLSMLTKLPGALKKLTSMKLASNDVDNMAKNMAAYASALIRFVQNVGDFTGTQTYKVKAASEAGGYLAEMLSKVPTFGGWKATILGNHTWTDFSTGLEAYGEALAGYAVQAENIVPHVSAIKDSANVGESLTTLLESTPNVGGALQAVIGKNMTWEDFGNGLEQFGKDMVAFGVQAKLMQPNKEAIADAVGIGESLKDLLNALPKESDWKESFLMGIGASIGGGLSAITIDRAKLNKTEETTSKYTVLFDGLVEFGTRMREFSDEINSIKPADATVIKRVSEAAQALATALSLAPELKKKGPDEGNYERITKGLGQFGNSLQKFSDQMKDIDTTQFARLPELFQALNEAYSYSDWEVLTNISTTGEYIKAYGDQLKAFNQAIKNDIDWDQMTKAVSWVQDSFKDDDFKNLADMGNAAGSSFYAGWNDFWEVNGDTSQKMYKDVGFILKGLILGIKDRLDSFKREGGYAANAFLEGWHEPLEIASPSGKFREDVKWIVEGFEQGIDEGKKRVAKCGEVYGDTFLGGFDFMKIKDALVGGEGNFLTELTDQLFGKGFDVDSIQNIMGDSLGKIDLSGLSNFDMSSMINLDDMSNFDFAQGIFGDKQNEALERAKASYDVFFHDLQKGYIDAGEYDRKYVELVKQYTAECVAENKKQIESQKQLVAAAQARVNAANASVEANPEYQLEKQQALVDDLTEKVEKYTTIVNSSNGIPSTSAREAKTLTEFGVSYSEASKNLREYNTELATENKRLQELQSTYSDDYDDYKDSLSSAKSELRSAESQLESAQKALQALESAQVEVTASSEIAQYASEHTTEWITSEIQKRTDAFQSAVNDAQSKMDNLKSSLSKNFDDLFIYTTNRDVYNKKIDEYTKQQNALNRELEDAKERYGENSIQVQQLERRIESLRKEEESYKDFYEREGFKDDEIVGIEENAKAVEDENEKLRKYSEYMNQLKEMDVSQAYIDYIASLDLEKGLAQLTWATQTASPEDLKRVEDAWTEHQKLLADVGKTVYGNLIDDAQTAYTASMTAFYNSLEESPESQAIAKNIIQNLLDSFSEETQNTLEEFGTNGKLVLNAVKEALGFETDDSVTNKKMSEAGRNSGEDFGDGVSNGIVSKTEKVASAAGDMADAALDEVERRIKNRDWLAKMTGFSFSAKTSKESATNVQNDIAETTRRKKSSDWITGQAGGVSNNKTVNMTVNNYSPTERTRAEQNARNRDAMTLANAAVYS